LAELVLPNVNAAAISPDGKSLALLRDKEQGDFAMSLWMMVPPAAPVKYTHPSLASKPISQAYLRFSPDGTRLAAWVALLLPKSPTEFWEIPLDGGEPRRQETWGSSFPRPQPFAWMPDNRRVVFASELKLGFAETHIWIADTRSGELRSITASQASQAYPSVAPDGKRIVFCSEDAEFDLVEIPLDGSATRALLATSRTEREPVWSPTSSEYAFVSNRNGFEEIWLRSADGTWERPLVRPIDFTTDSVAALSSISFSPDGRRIAFQASTHDVALASVWIANVAGGTPVPLTGRKAFEDHPAWSPDGRWIAFTAMKADGAIDLVKVRPGGDDVTTILREKLLVNTEVSWSPRGDVILCETVDGMTFVSPDGREQRVISEDTWLAHEWSRDGSRIYALKVGEFFDIVLVSVNPKDGSEEIIRNLGPSAPMNRPLMGLTLSPDGKSLATSIVNLRGDLWLLEGFAPANDSASPWWKASSR
jgi:Tol biopolymer transport system component